MLNKITALFVFGLAFPLASAEFVGSSAQNVSAVAATDVVTAEFVGSSGGMKLFPNAGGPWLMLQQDKLQEIGASGKKIGGGESLAGQNQGWTTSNDSSNVAYTTIFSKFTNNYNFSLTAHLSKITSTIDEIVPCSQCKVVDQDDDGLPDAYEIANGLDPYDPTDGSVDMLDAYNSLEYTIATCQDSAGVCSAALENGTCATNFTQCKNTVSVVKDELKFSVFLSGWNFADMANSLEYGIFLDWKGKGENSTAEVANMTDQIKANIAGIGYVVMPTKAFLKGGEHDDEEIEINITTSEQGGKTLFLLNFPAFAAGRSIYYDPVVAVETGDTSGVGYTSCSVHIVVFLAVLASVFA